MCRWQCGSVRTTCKTWENKANTQGRIGLRDLRDVQEGWDDRQRAKKTRNFGAQQCPPTLASSQRTGLLRPQTSAGNTKAGPRIQPPGVHVRVGWTIGRCYDRSGEPPECRSGPFALVHSTIERRFDSCYTSEDAAAATPDDKPTTHPKRSEPRANKQLQKSMPRHQDHHRRLHRSTSWSLIAYSRPRMSTSADEKASFGWVRSEGRSASWGPVVQAELLFSPGEWRPSEMSGSSRARREPGVWRMGGRWKLHRWIPRMMGPMPFGCFLDLFLFNVASLLHGLVGVGCEPPGGCSE